MSKIESMQWIFEQEEKARKTELEQKLKQAKYETEMETFNACMSIACNSAAMIAIASIVGGCNE